MTINVTGVNDPPSVANDAYTTVGNTELVAAGATLTSLARVIDATNPLANDMDGEEMSALSVSALGADTTAPFTGTSTLGGNVTINANGSFTYVPPIGVKNRLDNTGSGGTDDRDSFVYTATDGTATANASVFISIINELLWYVHNDPAGEALNPAGGDGRSNDPFDLLNDNVDDAPDDDAQEASGDSEHIFVFEGDTTTTGQNLGISLKDGQKLIGHNATTLLVGGVTITLPTPGGRPKITNSLPAVMADASTSDRTGVEIRNLDLAGGGATGSNSNAIDVTAAGANNVEVTIDNCFIRDAADEGIDLNPNGSGTFTATVTNNEYATSSPAGNAFDLTTTMATTGQVELDFSNNTNITSGNGDGVNVNASTIGTGGIVFITNFANNQVHGNTGGIGICMDTVTFDTTPASSVFQTVSGGDTDVGTIGNAVGASGIVLDDVSGDLSFTDLDIFNLNGDGLFIDGTDPLSPAMNPISGFGFATGAGSTIDSLGFFFGGAGADLNDLTITASGATFASISSDGDQTVALDTVSGGTFEVTGMTTSVNSADDGIDFNDTTATVTFSGPVSITDTFDDGIDIDNSFDTTITFSDTVTITGAGDDGVSLNGANSGTPTGSVSFNGLLDIDSGD